MSDATRSTCTENCGFTEDLEQFTGMDTVVLPISVDSLATPKEAYFLVDKDGVCRQHARAKLGDRREDAELLRVISAL